MRNELGQFIPGESGNPSGRPALPISLVKALEKKLRDDPKLADEVIDSWIQLAKSNDMPAIRELLDRIDGKVADKHLIQGLIIHVGDEYARLGLAEAKKDIEARQIATIKEEK